MQKSKEHKKLKNDRHKTSDTSNISKENNHIRLLIKKEILKYKKQIREQENQK